MKVATFTDVREAGTSQTKRQRRGWRPTSTHLLIGLAAVAAFVLNIAILQDQDAVVEVTVADGSLESGAIFNGSDVRLVEINADFEGLDSLLTSDEVVERTGWVLTRPVADGQVIDRSVLVPAETASGNSAMALPVGVEHAAGGVFVAGDHVDVISVVDGVAEYVLRHAQVVRVPATESGGFGSVGSYYVVVEVAPDDALSVARAMSQGSIEVLQSSSEPGGADGR